MPSTRRLPIGLVVTLDDEHLPGRMRGRDWLLGEPTDAPADCRIRLRTRPPLRRAHGNTQLHTVRGNYRRVPWWVTGNADWSQIEFCAPAFRAFLFKRIVWLPLMKRYAAAQGGIALAGSAYLRGDVATVLIGPPGSGKTRALISAVENGAAAIGDSEVAILPGGRVEALTPDLDLRPGTLSGTPSWAELSRSDQWRVQGLDRLTRLSGRRAAFSWGTRLDQVLPRVAASARPGTLRIEVKSASNGAGAHGSAEGAVARAHHGGGDGSAHHAARDVIAGGSVVDSVARFIGDDEAQFHRTYASPLLDHDVIDRSVRNLRELLASDMVQLTTPNWPQTQ